jgi:elongation factor P
MHIAQNRRPRVIMPPDTFAEALMNVAVKRGMLLRHQGHLYFVEDVSERHSGQMRPTFHVHLRALADGRKIDRALDELTPVEEVPHSYRNMQYLYAKGEARVFMDVQSFDEIELSGPAIGGFEPFLVEGQEYRVLFAGEQPVRLDIPDAVPLKVADTAAPTHAVGAASSILKEARLENGLNIRVPLFIKTGDVVRVSTHKREYLGKVQQ